MRAGFRRGPIWAGGSQKYHREPRFWPVRGATPDHGDAKLRLLRR